MNFTVPILLGRSYIDRYVNVTFQKERMIVSNNSSSVAVLG